MLNLNPQWRLYAYFASIVPLSLIGYFYEEDLISYIYTGQKGNLFNQLFVKHGWLWTVTVLAPFTFRATSTKVKASLVARLAAATAVWYFCTNSFDFIRDDVGIPIDISGHCFIAAWSNVVVTEEVKFSSSLIARDPWTKKHLNSAAGFSLLWDLMFVSTVLFYHSVPEKLIAVALAYGFWHLLYQKVFPVIFSVPKSRKLD